MTDSSVNPTDNTSPRAKRGRSSPVVDRNMRALAELAEAQRRDKSMQDKFAILVSRFAGQMRFVYVHLFVFGLWIIANTRFMSTAYHFDPHLNGLNTLATLEAIFLATFVLIAQNRMSETEEIRNHLDVQVSLLTEEETTQILRLVAKIGEKMDIAEANDPEIKHLIRNIRAGELIEQIEGAMDSTEEAARAR